MSGSAAACVSLAELRQRSGPADGRDHFEVLGEMLGRDAELERVGPVLRYRW